MYVIVCACASVCARASLFLSISVCVSVCTGRTNCRYHMACLNGLGQDRWHRKGTQ
jgi:hypothetical protein